jgi:hypothetical protein
MTERPVNPFDAGRTAVRDDKVRTTDVSPEAADALNRWTEKYRDELVEVLAPHGLHPYDVAQPRWERVVYQDELEEGTYV